jgi:23S rRNA-/tRNA-specific pseudouridylate synthase
MAQTSLHDQAAALLRARPDPTRTVHIVEMSDDLVVVDKPPGLPSDATPDPARDSARAAVFRLLRDASPTVRPPVLVHRLDAATSGLLLFARDADAAARAQRCFSERRVVKGYLALVEGAPAEPWEVRDYLRVPKRVGPGHPVERVRAGGQPAHTHFAAVGGDAARSVVAARPITGRTHQIRVHLTASGYPIVGDALYDGPPAPRLWLHAHLLAMRIDGRTHVWRSSPPAPLDIPWPSAVAAVYDEAIAALAATAPQPSRAGEGR